MQKIRAKDKCPCGSNKKYKNCCMPQVSSNIALEELSKYEVEDLISKLAYLQLNPNYPIWVPRIQTVINFVASRKESGKEKVSLVSLQKFIETCEEINLPHGDLANSLFCARFPFNGTNYHVYPDSIVDETKSLQLILNALLQLQDQESFIQKCSNITKVLLSISENIASELLHRSNIPYGDNIFSMNNNSQSFLFSENELRQKCELCNLTYEDLKPFIIDINEEITPYWEENHIFYYRPILKIGSQYIVVYPKSILSAIRHFIILEARESNILDQLLTIHNELVKQEIEILCSRTGYKQYSTDQKSCLELNEMLLEFDIDKLCYIFLVNDDCIDYDPTKPYIDSNSQKDIMPKIKERRTYVIDNLCKGKYSETLSLLVNVGIGRSCSVMGKFVQSPDNHYVCILSYKEFITYLKKTNINQLSLYKLTKSILALYSDDSLPPIFFDFLDIVAIYDKHKQSFYFSDEKAIMTVFPGEAVELVKDSVCKYDLQYTDYYQPNQRILVEKLEPDIDEALYIPSSFVGSRYPKSILVKCYKKNLWIVLKDIQKDFLLGKTLASWLLHLKVYLEPYINQFKQPIIFNINIDESDIKNDILTHAESNMINIQVAKKLFEQNWDDNEFEVLLVSATLKEFITLCQFHCIPVSQEDMEKIIKAEIPLGDKKFLQFFHSHNTPQLIGLFTNSPQIIGSCDIEKQLDGLGIKIHNRLQHLQSSKNIPKEERKIFITTIQEIFLDQIKTTVNKYDTRELLERLLMINELIVHQRAFRDRTGVSSAYCFSTIQQRAREISNIEKEIAGISIGVRFLIELIVATDVNNHQHSISQNSLDELVAAGYHYVNWGFNGQNINCNISNIDFQILNSGRVGTKSDLEPILDAYRDNKSLELLESYIEKNKKEELESTLLQSFQQGFQEEFGISDEMYLKIFSVIINYAISIKRDIVTIFKSKLIKIIKESIETTEDEINAFIDNFSLTSREKWEAIPIGFNNNEIFPWIYKRRLSLNKKPLLILPKEKDTLIMYGFRQCCEVTQLFLNDLKSANVNRGHYKSSSLSKFFGALEKKQGNAFEMKVFDWFQANKLDTWEVKRKICIGPNELLKDSESLGDVDIFIINKARKKIYACECKDLSSSRNPAEVANEIERLTDDSKKKSYSTLHMNRAYWLKNNFDQVKNIFNLKKGRWEIIPWMIFSRGIPTTLIKQLPSATTSLYEIKRQGIKTIENQGKHHRIKVPA